MEVEESDNSFARMHAILGYVKGESNFTDGTDIEYLQMYGLVGSEDEMSLEKPCYGIFPGFLIILLLLNKSLDYSFFFYLYVKKKFFLDLVTV